MAQLIRFLSHPSLRFLHEGARLFLVTASRALLGLAARGSGARWLVRNSAAAGGGFHFLFSDIDYSLLLPATESQTVARLRRRYFLLRRFLPWLGELEVYSLAEWNRLADLQARHGAVYQRLRHFRKINWMRLAAAQAKNNWERMKYERSVEKSLQQLGADSPEEALVKSLRGILKKSPVYRERFFCSYLGCWINGKAAELAPYPCYALPPDLTLRLAATMPSVLSDAHHPLPSGAEVLRESGELRELWLALGEIEALVVRAVNRGIADVSPAMQDWEKGLWLALAGRVDQGGLAQ